LQVTRGCVAAAVIIIPAFHLARTGELFYSKASHVFLLAIGTINALFAQVDG